MATKNKKTATRNPKPGTRSSKLWGGRFENPLLPLVDKFTESFSFDKRLFIYDVRVNIAHVKMLKACKIIPQKSAAKLLKALNELQRGGESVLQKNCEDVHTAVEHVLRKKLGEDAGFLGTARSRNDLVSTITRLYVKEQSKEIITGIAHLIAAFQKKQRRYASVLMPGFTHLQPAQKIKAGAYFGAYAEMLKRDKQRFSEALSRCDAMPLGACALAGTQLPVNRKMTRRELGFKSLCENTLDAVSDRDFILDFLYAASVLVMHLSRFSEDLILWVNPYFNFARIPDEFCTGSSLLPQKKNPDVPELVRGKSGRVAGNLMSVLVMMKGLPMTYNRDMQEDKERLFDTSDTLQNILNVMLALVPSISLNEKRLAKAAREGYLEAIEAAEFLVSRSVPFRKAHEISGKMVGYLEKSGRHFSSLTKEELRAFSPHFSENIFGVNARKTKKERGNG